MHKSGTTLVAEILHKSQISMVDEVQSNLSYEGDKFERKTTNEINKELLKCSHSLTWADQSLQCNDEQAGRIRQMIAVCENKYTAWGFKDPRTCLTYHIWKQILPDHKILIVYRNPYQVMAHYFNSTRRLDKLLIRSYKALQAWKKYNLLLLQLIENGEIPTFVINFQDLMLRDDILLYVADFVGQPLYDARDTRRYQRQKEQSMLYHLFEIFSGYQARKIYSRLEKYKSYA
jgi:hypothetical protein